MQPIFNIAEICASKDIKDCILSPGSRCAPLTVSFVRHPDINTITISDERSAAFIGIGIAQQTKRTVALVCTSGSAAYNYAPAVAEAFYQHIPLLLLTADRPPEWIGQQDGQTIQQNNIYGSHVKASYTLPTDYNHPDAIWHCERIISEAINASQQEPKGPVHVNVPLREPLYKEAEEEPKFGQVKTISIAKTQTVLTTESWLQLKDEINKAGKLLLIAGQQNYNTDHLQLINSLINESGIPIVAGILSSLYEETEVIHNADAIFLAVKPEETKALKPDLLITFGDSVLSKSLKNFIRKNKPKQHWHIQEAGPVADTFQSLTTIIPVKPAYFLQILTEIKKDKQYLNLWLEKENKARKKFTAFINSPLPFNEFQAIANVMEQLPDNSILHLANSMAVRYADYIGLTGKKNIEIFANRGTSGIDGVVSTAYGAALATEKLVTVITGDMAFFYDRNAFWNNYTAENLRIVMLNNHGGGIFRVIDGPSKLPELDEYFETKQSLTAKYLASEYGFSYYYCQNTDELTKAFKNFFHSSDKPVILEVETDSKTNTAIFKEFKNLMN